MNEKLLSEKKKSTVLNPALFHERLEQRSCGLFSLVRFCRESQGDSGEDRGGVFSRLFLNRLFMEASQLEEFLDACGVRGSRRWFPFRRYVAALKAFSSASSTLLHLQRQAYVHELLNTGCDFFLAASESQKIFHGIISDIFREIQRIQERENLSFGSMDIDLDEELPEGRLEYDRERTHIDNPGISVVHLATTFLNLSEDVQLFDIHGKVRTEDYASCFPDILGEARIRRMENKFHTLQSNYDTYISDSDIEFQDSTLPVLRGHVSVIFHLLEVATLLSHFFERHMRVYETPGISEKTVLCVLVEFCLAYVSKFLSSARSLCRSMIQSYAQPGEIEVAVPRYRGFHVRPSTLVAKIVVHYGSDVFLKMDNGKTFNAASPLELFRVNESINSEKRKKLQELIENELGEFGADACSKEDLQDCVRKILLNLLERRRLVLYDSDLSFSGLEPIQGEIVGEYAKRVIAHFLALGKIDIQTEMKVRFAGDKRVLADIRLLAEHGYGEDSHGNNIMLPKELSYLRR